MSRATALDRQSDALSVERLVKVYVDRRERVLAVDEVTFKVEPGRFYTLLGPSGCGKTTTLRCVAGLERPDGGAISIAGRVTNDAATGRFVPPHQRDIGMVFQSYAIWPHMDVFGNVAFPLRHGKVHLSGREISQRVGEALALVHLDGLGERLATRLSGGQQQRLALARALVRRPKLLLLDEPLSNLDAKLREELRVELRSLQRQLGITTLYVTHDQVEALSMSNRIAVMSQGRIVQEGTAHEIYESPASDFVARFVGTANFFAGNVAGPGRDGRHLVETAIGMIEATCPDGVVAGEKVTVTVRPENVRVHAAPPAAAPNLLAGEVATVMFLGEYLDCRVRVGTQLILTRQHPRTRFRRGDAVQVELDPELLTVFSDRGVTGAQVLGERGDTVEG